jgi:predicted Zn-dependent peptidase
LVERGHASSVSGALLPTAQPFLYAISLTAMKGTSLQTLEGALFDAIDDLRANGVTDVETARARRQLRARLVFENDSVTNIAHQIGYFETVAGLGLFPELLSRIEAVTPEQVSDVARRRLDKTARTIGWYQPLEIGA